MTTENEQKRYKNRPLVMVFYGIDFSFEHREGMVVDMEILFSVVKYAITSLSYIRLLATMHVSWRNWVFHYGFQ